LVLLRYSSAIAAAAPGPSLSNDVFGELERDESTYAHFDPFRLNIIFQRLSSMREWLAPPRICSAAHSLLTQPIPARIAPKPVILQRNSSAITAAVPCLSLSNDVFGEMERDESTYAHFFEGKSVLTTGGERG
jgi:hypothetical protein